MFTEIGLKIFYCERNAIFPSRVFQDLRLKEVFKPFQKRNFQFLQSLLDLEVGEVMLFGIVYILNFLDVLKLIFFKGFELLKKFCFRCHFLLVNLRVKNELQLLHDVVPKCLSITFSCPFIVVCVMLSVLFVVIQSVSQDSLSNLPKVRHSSKDALG